MAVERTKAFRALKHLGKVATQFEFSFYIDRIENVPTGVDFIFSVQRGERLCSSSECRSVQLAYRSNGVVAFRELLVLPVTLYMSKVGGDFLPKYAKFFLRRVGKAGTELKTQGKVHLDLSRLIRNLPGDENTVFHLSDGSKLFMTISWKSSMLNRESDSKDSIVKTFEKVLNERIFGNRDKEIKPGKVSLDFVDVSSPLANDNNLEEREELANERKHSLDNVTARKPRQMKDVLAFGQRNKSFDDSKSVREGIVQKLMNENSLLRKHLVEFRSEMEHHYLMEATQKAEISKLRAELRGFHETVQKNRNYSELSCDTERIVETNKELLEQFKKLEENYKSQVRSLFGEVYKLRETVTRPSFISSDKLENSSRDSVGTYESTEGGRIASQSEFAEASLKWRYNDHRGTQIHYLQKQLLLQREESANLLSELIRTKVSLALALENVEWLSFQHNKQSKQNRGEIPGALWAKILPWKFE
ncbi:hypothetical protein GpartN1_g2540.t1 [Galdieria partita]|uniref:C2 NT-type domain-containing protein n=1 Tax=Galdieria partita TaxID=83374 RepID=A0A9C7UPB4_9RHOD|nr:hypothetical protein GpartN1_g2540.t1 [Galdieria partita]